MDVGTVARTNQNASSFVNGVYLPGSALFLPMEDLQRTEVVKGPQSAFFGRATFGGAINLIMKSPTPEFMGDAAAVVGSNERVDLNVGVGGPISDAWAFRVFGRYYDYGGGWENPAPNSDTLGAQSSLAGSASISFQPSGKANFELRVLYDEDDDGPGTNIFFPSSILNCGPLTQDGQVGTSQYYCGTLTRDLANPVGYDTTIENVPGVTNWPKDDFGLEREFMLANFAFDVGLSDSVTLDSLTSYLTDETINVDDFTGDGQMLWWYNNDDTLFSQELRVSGTSEQIDWLVGGYYLNAEYEDLGNGFGCADPNALLFGFLPFCPQFGWENVRGFFDYNLSPPLKIENTALFGSVNWRVSDSVSLSAEGRFARETIDEGVIENLVDGSLIPLQDDFDSFSPRVILNWMASDEGMFYASIAQGNKPGNFNADFTRDVGTACQDAFTDLYGIGRTVPEAELINYEVGWKHNINRGRHRFNAAGYYMDWTNQQFRSYVNQVDTNCDGVVDENDEFQVDGLISAGKSEIIGAELFYTGWLGQYFNLFFSYNYNYTQYKEFEDRDYGRVYGSPDASGKEMPRSPRNAGNIGLTFRIPIGTGTWDFFARADSTYTGSSWTWAHNLAKTEDAFRTNLRAGVESDRWAFSAWVENVTDNDAVLFVRRFTDFTNYQTGFWGGLSKPREYGVTARIRF
jgi:outer membrane receptor protein involved in Fe transport